MRDPTQNSARKDQADDRRDPQNVIEPLSSPKSVDAIAGTVLDMRDFGSDLIHQSFTGTESIVAAPAA